MIDSGRVETLEVLPGRQLEFKHIHERRIMALQNAKERRDVAG